MKSAKAARLSLDVAGSSTTPIRRVHGSSSTTTTGGSAAIADVSRAPSAPFPKFVIHCGTLSHELRKQRGTSKYMILVPLFDLKFLNELAGTAVGTSNRRH